MKKIAVLMPAFNAGETIAKAVESMLWQELPPHCAYEVAVFDDGSTDATRAILERIAGRRRDGGLRILGDGTRVGEAAARNRLLQAADADYYFVMDADDIALPGRVRAQVEALDAGHDLVGTHVYNFGAMHGDRRFLAERPAHVLLAMVDQRSFCHPAIAFNRKVARIGYPKPLASDYGLLIEVLLAGLGVTNLPRHYLMYRVHGKSQSNSTDADVFASLRKAVCEMRADYLARLLGLDASAAAYSDCMERKIFRRDTPEDLVALDRLGAIVRDRLGVGVDFRRV